MNSVMKCLLVVLLMLPGIARAERWAILVGNNTGHGVDVS